jgi:hypothetical protein
LVALLAYSFSLFRRILAQNISQSLKTQFFLLSFLEVVTFPLDFDEKLKVFLEKFHRAHKLLVLYLFGKLYIFVVGTGLAGYVESFETLMELVSVQT